MWNRTQQRGLRLFSQYPVSVSITTFVCLGLPFYLLALTGFDLTYPEANFVLQIQDATPLSPMALETRTGPEQAMRRQLQHHHHHHTQSRTPNGDASRSNHARKSKKTISRVILGAVSDPRLWQSLGAVFASIEKVDVVQVDPHQSPLAVLQQHREHHHHHHHDRAKQAAVYLPLPNHLLASIVDAGNPPSLLLRFLRNLNIEVGVERVDVVILRQFVGTSLCQSTILSSHHSLPEVIQRVMLNATNLYRLRGGIELAQNSASQDYPSDIRIHEWRLEDWLNVSKSKNERTFSLGVQGLVGKLGLDWEPQQVSRSTFLDMIQHDSVCNQNTELMPAFIRWLGSRSHTELRALPPLPHLRLDGLFARTNIVCITQIRNVAHTIDSFLESIDPVVDRILFMDTGSSDGTLALIRARMREPRWQNKLELRESDTVRGKMLTKPKKTVDKRRGLGKRGNPKKQTKDRLLVQIDTDLDLIQQRQQQHKDDPAVWHEGTTYWELLNWARECGATHVLCPDSDEYPTANWHRHSLLRHLVLSLAKKTALVVPLFHVWNGTDRWISTPPKPWPQSNRAPLAWRDDGVSHRGRGIHHIKRTPGQYHSVSLVGSRTLGSVHFKFASPTAIRVKTLWYRYMEYDAGSRSKALSSFYQAKIPRNLEKNHSLDTVHRREWYDYQQHSTNGGNTHHRHDDDAAAVDPTAWTERWTEPQSWAWRVQMILDWRTKWQRTKTPIPKALSPPNPAWIRRAAGLQPITPTTTTTTTHNRTPVPPITVSPTVVTRPHVSEFDAKCLRAWIEYKHKGHKGIPVGGALSQVVPVPAVWGGAPFLWAVAPDHTMVRWLRDHEIHVRAFSQHALTEGCLSNTAEIDKRPLVLDVGANSGYYGLSGMSLGCNAVFVEPQPYCGMLIETSLAANQWGRDRGSLVRVAAGNENRERGIEVWCNTACYGRVGAPGVSAAVNKFSIAPPSMRAWRPSRPIQDLVGSRNEIALLKIDVEGAEANVLRGARRLFQQRQVRAATIEVTPQFYREWKKEGTMRQEIYTEFAEIARHGYRIWAPRRIRDIKTDHGPGTTDTTTAKGTKARPGTGNARVYYQCLETDKDLRDYLLQTSFQQHDLFVYRCDNNTDNGAGGNGRAATDTAETMWIETIYV